jgi:hypothetical protein
VTEPLDPAAIADLLEVAPVVLDAELRAAGDELASWPPGPGEWSMKACVGHLIEAERRGFAGRIKIIVGSDRPTLETWDQPSVALERRDHERPLEPLLAEFRSMRAEGVALVRSLGADDLDRVGLHPEVGELRVRDLLAEWVHHDRNHVRQALAIAQSRVWPQMGNARRFSELEAGGAQEP